MKNGRYPPSVLVELDATKYAFEQGDLIFIRISYFKIENWLNKNIKM